MEGRKNDGYETRSKKEEKVKTMEGGEANKRKEGRQVGKR